MPDEFWIDSAHMLVAGIIVAAFALVLVVIARAARRSGQPLLLPWRMFKAPWGCFEALVVFIVVQVLIPVMVLAVLDKSGIFPETVPNNFPSSAAQGAVAGMPVVVAVEEQKSDYASLFRMLCAGVVSFPLQLSLLIGWGRLLYPSWWLMQRPPLSSLVLVAVGIWAVLTPLVLIVNGLITLVFTCLHWPTDTHQLAKIAGRPLLDSCLFLIQVCIAAPAIEEILFRGIILSWAIGGRRDVPVPDVPGRARPILIVLLGLAWAALSGRTGAIIFSAALTAGLMLVPVVMRRKRRTAGAVYSSAAFFAAVHSSVWPSPIPLFFFGLGLGMLAVRTRSIVAPAIVHALFNAVSAVFVLRSAG